MICELVSPFPSPQITKMLSDLRLSNEFHIEIICIDIPEEFIG